MLLHCSLFSTFLLQYEEKKKLGASLGILSGSSSGLFQTFRSFSRSSTLPSLILWFPPTSWLRSCSMLSWDPVSLKFGFHYKLHVPNWILVSPPQLSDFYHLMNYHSVSPHFAPLLPVVPRAHRLCWVYSSLSLFHPQGYPSLKFTLPLSPPVQQVSPVVFCKYRPYRSFYVSSDTALAPGLLLPPTSCRFWNCAAAIAWLGFALAAFCAFYAVFASPSQDTLSGPWGGCSFTFHKFHLLRDIIAWGFTSQVYLLSRWIPDGTIRIT